MPLAGGNFSWRNPWGVLAISCWINYNHIIISIYTDCPSVPKCPLHMWIRNAGGPHTAVDPAMTGRKENNTQNEFHTLKFSVQCLGTRWWFISPPANEWWRFAFRLSGNNIVDWICVAAPLLNLITEIIHTLRSSRPFAVSFLVIYNRRQWSYIKMINTRWIFICRICDRAFKKGEGELKVAHKQPRKCIHRARLMNRGFHRRTVLSSFIKSPGHWPASYW